MTEETLAERRDKVRKEIRRISLSGIASNLGISLEEAEEFVDKPACERRRIVEEHYGRPMEVATLYKTKDERTYI